MHAEHDTACIPPLQSSADGEDVALLTCFSGQKSASNGQISVSWSDLSQNLQYSLCLRISGLLPGLHVAAL